MLLKNSIGLCFSAIIIILICYLYTVNIVTYLKIKNEHEIVFSFVAKKMAAHRRLKCIRNTTLGNRLYSLNKQKQENEIYLHCSPVSEQSKCGSKISDKR